MRFEQANDLFKPGYLPFESGYQTGATAGGSWPA
jgi:hypothetical protein